MYIALNSGERLYENSVIMLSGSSERYIVKHGWFSYNGTNTNGWYFQAISDGTIIPATAENLVGISILENGDFVQNVNPSGLPECESYPPIVFYQTNTKYRAGQIVYREFGVLYQVCTTYISVTIEDDIANGYLSTVEFSSDAPYTNPAVPAIQTVRDALDYIISALNAHVADTNNPHSVTAEQVGFDSESLVPGSEDIYSISYNSMGQITGATRIETLVLTCSDDEPVTQSNLST